MLEFIIITCFFFCVFLWGVYENYGILKSISDSFYKLLAERKGWLFRLFIIDIAVSFAIIGQHWSIYIAAIMLLMVAVFAMFKRENWKTLKRDKLECTVHVFGATGSIALGFIYQTFFLHYYWAAIPTILFLAYAYPSKISKGIFNYTWWIEVFSFYNIMFIFLIENI